MELNPEYKRLSEKFAKTLFDNGMEDINALLALKYLSEIFSKKGDKLTAYKITAAFYNYLLKIETKSSMVMDG